MVSAMSDNDENGIVLTEEQKRRRRARSIAIALSLGALVVLFYIVTLVKRPGRAEPAAVIVDEPAQPPQLRLPRRRACATSSSRRPAARSSR